MIKKILFVLLIILIVAILIAPIISAQVEIRFNKVIEPPPYKISDQALKVHHQILVADLHADSLLWARNLKKREDYGHLDFPRMDQSNLSLQVFGIVTQTPKGKNFSSNSSQSDQLVALSMAQLWPRDTWFSPFNRALYQANRLHNYAQDLDNKLSVITSKQDLINWLATKKPQDQKKAGLLAIEGAHALEGKIENYLAIKQAGIRMIGLAHFFDNKFAGSAHGVKKHGLTELGKQLVLIAQQDGLLIDLAHSSPKTIDDVLQLSKRPLVVSHTGVKATCNSSRNLSDHHIKAIASSGGVIGIAVFKGATCGNSLDSMLDAVDHVVELVGVDYVGLGLDLDGAVTSPFDASGIALITQGLIARGYTKQEIEKIMGLNVVRVLSQALN